MSGVNKAILVGNLGRDPDVRRTAAGAPVVTFSIATGESWRDKATGERRERTEWHNVVIFNENLGKIAEQYLRKGAKVFVEGQIRTREYTDKDGGQRKVTEIVLAQFGGSLTLLDKADRPAPEADSYGKTTARSDDYAAAKGRMDPNKPMAGQIDDDIPF